MYVQSESYQTDVGEGLAFSSRCNLTVFCSILLEISYSCVEGSEGEDFIYLSIYIFII